MNSVCADPPGKKGYHHGALRSALVEASIALAREGGPDRVVLREAAGCPDTTPVWSHQWHTRGPNPRGKNPAPSWSLVSGSRISDVEPWISGGVRAALIGRCGGRGRSLGMCAGLHDLHRRRPCDDLPVFGWATVVGWLRPGPIR